MKIERFEDIDPPAVWRIEAWQFIPRKGLSICPDFSLSRNQGKLPLTL